MAEFVRAQIFGTTFEITSRLVARECGHNEAMERADITTELEALTTVQIHRSSTRRHGRLRAGMVRTEHAGRKTGDT